MFTSSEDMDTDEGGIVKKFMFVNRKAPYGTIYALESLEVALSSQGFHLDNSLLSKLKRALAYFSESVQRRNLAANEPDAKSQQAFVKVYERHLHGDSDETPEEWREYK